MSSLTDIANLALSHIGQGDEIQNYLTDTSKEAVACRRFMDLAIESTIGDYEWSFAKRIFVLNKVADDPTDDWSYSYRYPSDCLNFKRIITGDRNLTPDNIVPFEVYGDVSGKLIFCDENPATCLYIAKVTNVALMPSDLILALSYYLAFLIAPRVTAGDEFGASKRCMGMYSEFVQKAMARDANEGQKDKRPESEFIRYRDEG